MKGKSPSRLVTSIPLTLSPGWIDCPELATPEVLDVEFTGNVAWATVAAGSGTELRVYVRNDTGWERFPYSSEVDWSAQGGAYDEYMFELEDEAVGPTVRPAFVRTNASSVWAVEGDVYDPYTMELEDAAVGE